jgi:hypothetical protein
VNTCQTCESQEETGDNAFLLLRNKDFEPFILYKDGIGSSTLDEAGYQCFYETTPISVFLNHPDVTVIGSWREE